MKKSSSGIRGVFERPKGSGIYWIRFFDRGRGRIRSKKIGTKSAAEACAEAARTKVRKGEFIPECNARVVTFREIAEDALEYSKAHKKSYGDDLSRMGKLLDWFREQPAEAISARDIERRFEEEDWSPATCNRYKALLSLTYKLAIRSAKVKENPARLVPHRPEKNGRTRFLSPEEEVRLRAAIRENFPEHLPEFDLALHVGVRLGEQYAAHWADVDLEHRVLTLPNTKNGDTRRVRLNATALGALRELWQRTAASGFVCGGWKGPGIWFRQALQFARVQNFTWHSLRHTFASRLVMSGTDVRTVAELLGHKTLQMVMRYSHLAPDYQLAAVERMAAVFPKRSETAIETGSIAPPRCETAQVN